MEYSWLIIWCAFALLCGGLIKGTLGVGTPLLTVPMLTWAMPPQSAIAIMAVPVIVANVWQSLQAPKVHQVFGRFWPTALALLVGTTLGAQLLSTLNEKPLLLSIGCIIILFTLLHVSRYRITLTPEWTIPAGVLFGVAAGVIGGFSSMFGPMLIIYLLSIRDLDKDQFVSAISFLYVSAVVPWGAQLYFHGILDNTLLLYSCLGTAPVVLGMIGGQALRQHISEMLFKTAIFIILMLSGVSMLWRAFL